MERAADTASIRATARIRITDDIPGNDEAVAGAADEAGADGAGAGAGAEADGGLVPPSLGLDDISSINNDVLRCHTFTEAFNNIHFIHNYWITQYF